MFVPILYNYSAFLNFPYLQSNLSLYYTVYPTVEVWHTDISYNRHTCSFLWDKPCRCRNSYRREQSIWMEYYFEEAYCFNQIAKTIHDIVTVPIGQTATHIPQILLSIFNRVLPYSLHFSLHLKASKNTSQSVSISHNCPVAACAGHFSTQMEQLPHLDLSIGLDSDSTSLSIRILVSLNLAPNSFEMNKSVFPIQPSSALVATIHYKSINSNKIRYCVLISFIVKF